MDKIFKCDCGTHIIKFEYTGVEKDFDFEDFAISIFDVYNPDTGRRYKNPRLLGDVVLFNNKYPKELDKFFEFMELVIRSRKKPEKEFPNHLYEKDEAIEKSIKRVQELDKLENEKNKNEM